MCGPAFGAQDTQANRTIMVHERLTHQVLMHHDRRRAGRVLPRCAGQPLIVCDCQHQHPRTWTARGLSADEEWTKHARNASLGRARSVPD